MNHTVIMKQQQHKLQQPERHSNTTTSPHEKKQNASLFLRFIRIRTFVLIWIATIISAVMVRRLYDSSNYGFHISVPLSKVHYGPIFTFELERDKENLQYLWNRITQFCYIDMIRQNKDWIVWSTTFYTASFDTYRAILSSIILMVITAKYILQIIRYVVLRIVFPHGTKFIHTFILPQLYTQCYIISTQVILFHSHLTNEQIIYEVALIACSILFYFYCIPYLKRLRPIVQQVYRSYRQSIQQVRG